MAAGGIAVAHLVPEPSRDSVAALALGAAFVLLGVGVMAYGARQFSRITRQLAAGSGEPALVSTRGPYVLTAAVALLLLAVLWFLWTHQGRPLAQPASPAAAGGATATGPASVRSGIAPSPGASSPNARAASVSRRTSPIISTL